MNTTLHSSDILSVFEKQRKLVLKDQATKKIYPRTFFVGKIREIDYWSKQSQIMSLEEMIHRLENRRIQLRNRDIRVKKGRLNLLKLSGSLSQVQNLIAEFKAML